jgi:hypothetical protein
MLIDALRQSDWVITTSPEMRFVMAMFLSPPLAPPKNGLTYIILAICRISGPHQDPKSLEDQEASYREWLDRNLGMPYELIVVAGQGSGEWLDRNELVQSEEHVQSGKFDLVIVEDLGRIARRIHAQLFCEMCEDFDTRVIALNDALDTAHPNWRFIAGFSTIKHESSNTDGAQRIRRTLRNRFANGGVCQFVIFGYEKPANAKHDSELRKLSDAEPIYDQWFTRLERGESFAQVADWLNELGIQPGPYCRSKRWTGTMVGQVTRNPILKGQRLRNVKKSRRINATGRRRSVAAPKEDLLMRECPHLAFIEPDRYDRVLALLRERNQHFRRKGENGRDTRANVSKKRTRWPGQHIFCGVCDRMYVYGGHGQKDHLMCSGAKDYRCWNAVTMDGQAGAVKLAEAMFEKLAEMPEFSPELRLEVERQWLAANDTFSSQEGKLRQRLAKLQNELANLTDSIKQGRWSETIQSAIDAGETEKRGIEFELGQLARRPQQKLHLPTAEELLQMARAAVGNLAAHSHEFGVQARRLIPRIIVDPYRLCDGGHPVLRARFTLDLTGLLPALDGLTVDLSPLRHELSVDLFEPPQREQHRREVCRLRGIGLGQRQVAANLGITQPAVERALALTRQMDRLGLSDPYVRLTSPPDDYNRLRRHRHPRYKFEPLDTTDPME